MFDFLKRFKERKSKKTECENELPEDSGYDVSDFNLSEGETTVLSQAGNSSEGETTVLSQAGNSSEGETTVLSQAGNSSEGETTVLSQVGNSSEGETTMLSQAGNSSESETTVLSQDNVISQQNYIFSDDNYQKTEQRQRDYSENETTFLSEEAKESINSRNNRSDYYNEKECSSLKLILIRCSTGEQTEVTSDNFTIGKQYGGVSYVVDNPGVSRVHATITRSGNEFYISDNNSTNGTALEGVYLNPFEKARIYQDSLISIGSENFMVNICESD